MVVVIREGPVIGEELEWRSVFEGRRVGMPDMGEAIA